MAVRVVPYGAAPIPTLSNINRLIQVARRAYRDRNIEPSRAFDAAANGRAIELPGTGSQN